MFELIEKLETRVLSLIEELEKTRVQRNQLETENDGLKITLADYESVKADLEAARAQMAGAGDAAASVERLEAELSEARGELSAANELLAELESGCTAASDERDDLRGELETARGRIVSLEARVRELQVSEGRINALAEENAHLRARLADADAQAARTRERLSTLIARIEETESFLSELELAHETV